MVLARWQATIADEAGNIQPLASIEVRRETPGSPLVSLYSDRLGATPIGNPFTADSEGFAAFHLLGGAYRITATLGGFSRVWRYVGIGTAQEVDLSEEIAVVQNVSAGYALVFDTGTSAPPAAGEIRFNHASLASATQAFVSATNLAGSDISDRLMELFSAARAVKDSIILSDVNANTQASFTVTGATDNTTHITLTLSGHQGATSFGDGVPVNLQRERAGANGLQGIQGVQGIQGIQGIQGEQGEQGPPGDGDVSGPGGGVVAGQLVIFTDTLGSDIAGAEDNSSPAQPVTIADILNASALPDASEAQRGVIEMATDAEIRSAASGAKAIMAADLETASATVALTDAATVAVDWDTGINFTLTVTANRAIGNPTNGQPGNFRTILVQGNDATDRTITFGNQFLGEVPTITDCDSGRWYKLYIDCISSTHFAVSAKRVLG